MFLFVEGLIDGEISCSPQGNGKTYCCASVSDDPDKPYRTETWCTTCDETKLPSNCSKREQPLTVQPGKDLSNILQGGVSKGVLEPSERNMTFSEKIAPKSGGIFELPEDKDSKTFNEEDKDSKTFNEENNTGND
jgi:hypothetical protein